MSKYLKILLVLILVMLTGCGASSSNDSIKTYIKSVKQETAIEETAIIDANGNVTVVDEDGQTDDNIKSKESAHKKNSTDNTGESSSSSNKSDDISNSSTNTQTPNNNDNQMINVSISIDCKTILDNMNDLKAGYENFVGNGIILSKKTYKVKKGASIIDVLKSATSENKINLVTVSSAFGLYVKGIGYLEEKVCGSSSGWLYKVNGTFPSVSASEYRLNDGDRIEWRFTCKQGDV